MRETEGLRSFGEEDEAVAGGGEENWKMFADPESDHISLMNM